MPLLWFAAGLASSKQSTVALVYHGDYTRGTADVHDVTCQGPCTPEAEKQPKCTDFFSAAYNQYVNLIAPLQRMGMQPSTFFHSYSWTECPARDAALVDFLQPVAYRFDPQGRYSRIVDSYIAALELLLGSGAVSDYVLLLRFEALYDRGVDTLDVSWDRINVAFKASVELYNASGVTSDLFYAAPWRLLGALRDALDASGDVPQQWDGSGHYVYRVLEDAGLGDELHIIEDRYISSSDAAFGVCETPDAAPSQYGFVYLLRACTETACDAVLSACVGGEVITGVGVSLPACDGFGLLNSTPSTVSSGACAAAATRPARVWAPQMAFLGLVAGIVAGTCGRYAARLRRLPLGRMGRDPSAWQHEQPQSYDLRPNEAVSMATGRAGPSGKPNETALGRSM